MRNNEVATEDDLRAFANNWDQRSVADIPAALTDHFSGFLAVDQIAQTVPPDLRGASWLPDGGMPEHGVQLMAVDKVGGALVERITYWAREDVYVYTYAEMPIAEAIALRQKFSKRSLTDAGEDDGGSKGDCDPLAQVLPSSQTTMNLSEASFFAEEEPDIMKLESSSDDGSRMGWVNIGTHAVQIQLDSAGNLTVEVFARTDERDPLATCIVTKDASVEAGGLDPDADEDESSQERQSEG